MSHSFATVKKGGHGGSYGGATMREDYWVGAALTATISATLRAHDQLIQTPFANQIPLVS